MNLEKDNVIGIVGGMGPQAGITLYNNILRHTDANTDQEHLSVILMSFSKHIVDRTAFLEGEVSVNPAYNVIKVIEKLAIAGARVVGMPCNTLHAPRIFSVIEEGISKLENQVTLLSMPMEVCKYIKENFPQARRIGLMGTNGTFKSKIYQGLMEQNGYEVVVPKFDFQDQVIHKMIYDPTIGIKANPVDVTAEAASLWHQALDFFKEEKADAIILGCTELSQVHLPGTVTDAILIDSTEVLAKALVREATMASSEKHGLASEWMN